MLAYWDATPKTDPLYAALQQGLMNRWGAACAGLSVLLMAASILIRMCASGGASSVD
jgi:hypothetical protein